MQDLTKKRYLFYDNIVRGAGIGHTLACYAYGLRLAKENGLKFLADKTKLGHGVKDLEVHLGLEDFSQERREILNTNKDLIHFENYKKGAHPAIPILNWPQDIKKYFIQRYASHRKLANCHIKKDRINIAIAIRRGDIVNNPSFKSRLLPDSFYRDRLNKLLEMINPSSFKINVYSDGKPEDNRYINEKGQITSLKELLPELYPKAELYLGECNQEKTFEMIQNCVQSDYFIGSISGLSKLIMIYKMDVNCDIPL